LLLTDGVVGEVVNTADCGGYVLPLKQACFSIHKALKNKDF